MSSFQSRNVLITGAGSGIGAGLARALAAEGATVVLAGRRLEAVQQVADEITASGGQAQAMQLDVGKIDTFASFRQQLTERVGRLDILINNAGVVFGGEFEKVPLEKHLETYQTNIVGLMALTHAFFEDLIASTQGHLVNIASASSFLGVPWGSTYASSKWAVLGFSESIRLELKERGYDQVTVTSVCPSYISTGMFDGVQTPMLSPFLTTEKVVRATVKGMQKRQAFVQEPMIVKHLDLLKGTLPLTLWDTVTKTAGISTSMKSWRGKH